MRASIGALLLENLNSQTSGISKCKPIMMHRCFSNRHMVPAHENLNASRVFIKPKGSILMELEMDRHTRPLF